VGPDAGEAVDRAGREAAETAVAMMIQTCLDRRLDYSGEEPNWSGACNTPVG
jgi:hypothetical protein